VDALLTAAGAVSGVTAARMLLTSPQLVKKQP